VEEDSSKVVFVVSDDPLVREECEFGFPSDVTVEIYLDARDAGDAMAERTPAAVIVDLQTGNAGGFSLARWMRSLGHLQDVPILILLEREQDRWLAGQSGATVSRIKPISAASLVHETLGLISA
jgi:two-component system, OmpR family, phosphate regulon response regulator PhoB